MFNIDTHIKTIETELERTIKRVESYNIAGYTILLISYSIGTHIFTTYVKHSDVKKALGIAPKPLNCILTDDGIKYKETDLIKAMGYTATISKLASETSEKHNKIINEFYGG